MTDYISNADYAENVDARKTKKLHVELLPSGIVKSWLDTLVEQMNRLDSVKAMLFYGDDSKLDPMSLAYLESAAETLPHKDTWPAEISQSDIDMLHAVIGMATEVGELAQQVNKRFMQLMLEAQLVRSADDDQHITATEEVPEEHRTLDRVNVIEELGDMRWFYTLMVNALGTTDVEVRGINDAKLAKRHGDSYSEEGANSTTRDVDAEREVLTASISDGESAAAE